MNGLFLADWIHIDRSVARSVNLERDASNVELLQRFQVTSTARDVLNRLADAFEGESVNAWSLTGPYGTGKTAFCNFLISLGCGNEAERAICMKKISMADSKIAKRLKVFVKTDTKNVPPFIGIRAVSRYESLNSTLVRALYNSIEELQVKKHSFNFKKLKSAVTKLMEKEWPPTKEVVAAYQQLVNISKCKIFLVVDEFGKNLEYQVHHAAQGDIFALQALAESTDTYIWICLHQAFSEYAPSLSSVQKEEWQKIQGRFEDKSYIEPPSRTFDLIQKSLSLTRVGKEDKPAILRWAKAMSDAVAPLKLDNWPPLDQEGTAKLYPIHPLCVYLMGELTRRFAQNDRTLFSFLSSGEPKAFSEFLRRQESIKHNILPTLRLDTLYDYFSEINMLRYSDRAENQRWLEIQTLLASHGDLEHEKLRLLKVIGILNLLSSLPGICASADVIHAAMASDYYGEKRRVQKLLDELQNSQILLFRNYAGEYRLWEGSDFDLDAELVHARSQIILRPMSEVLSEVAPRPNLIAARHAYQSGTLREFTIRWSTEDDLAKLNEEPWPEPRHDGIVWLVLGRQKKPKLVEEIARPGSPVIVAYSPYIDPIRQLMIEAAANQLVLNAPQLQRDGVARKEAKHRAAQAITALSLFIAQTVTSGKPSTLWFTKGKQQSIRNSRELSALVSMLCDEVYSDCPNINNEMLNCEKLSSAGAKARREVAEALANTAHLKNVGFSGFGPEVAVYRSVFKDIGLHAQTSDGWKLCSPNVKQQPKFAAVWNTIDNLVVDADVEDNPVPVRKVLDVLKRPPFGLREGPAPLLLVHYLLIHQDDVAVYEEGVFKPFFGDAEITLLMKRPELFSLRRYLPTGVRKQIIQAYLQVINTDALRLASSSRNQTILSIVVPLTEFVKALPDYTLSTRDLSPNAMRLRNVLVNAREPQQLLFRDIPEALGFEAIATTGQSVDQTFSKNLREALWRTLTELRDKFDAFTSKVQIIMMQQLTVYSGTTPPLDDFRYEVRSRVESLVEKCTDIQLKPILATMRQEGDGLRSWVLQVAAQIMKKPVSSWRDGDLEPFAARLGELQQRIDGLIKLSQYAARQGQLNAKSRFVSMTFPDGRICGKVVQLDEVQRQTLVAAQKHLFEKNNPSMRKQMLVMLLEAMERKGELE